MNCQSTHRQWRIYENYNKFGLILNQGIVLNAEMY